MVLVSPLDAPSTHPALHFSISLTDLQHVFIQRVNFIKKDVRYDQKS